ncbi:GreA/GreB family elongation factor [Methylobacterium nigriterrae]|uniref:GreA/GreB family elongation factor n=1 Tax=Methylobacterium nigriterrae TaxID=3127512 RepID=UPI00301356E3
MNAVHELPPVTVSTHDYARLVVFGLDAYLRGDTHADFLLLELRRATLCLPRELPGEVVSVNCRVIYRLDDEPRLRSHLLVHPHDLADLTDELSAASPLGTALLGLRVGDWMPFCDNRLGTQHVVTVEGIGWRFVDEPVPGRGALAPRRA